MNENKREEGEIIMTDMDDPLMSELPKAFRVKPKGLRDIGLRPASMH